MANPKAAYKKLHKFQGLRSNILISKFLIPESRFLDNAIL